MERHKMYIGQKVRLPAKDIVSWEKSTDIKHTDNLPEDIKNKPDEWFFDFENETFYLKKVKYQKEKILYVRELYSLNVAGLSYTMDTSPERSMGIHYECIEPLNKKALK